MATPTDKNAMRAPAFQFYPRQFAGDNQVMTADLDAVGAHILLMCAAAASPEGCRIPADERAIRNLLRNPGDADWQRIKMQLLGGLWKASEDGAWWEQDGLFRTLQKQKAFSGAQSARAAKRYAGRLPDTCRESAGALPGTCSSFASTSSNLSSSEVSLSDEQPTAIASQEKQKEASQSGNRLASLLVSEIHRNKADYRITPAQQRNWAKTADLMLRRDGRTEEQIAALIRWAQRDQFWHQNILSMDKLREKFDQLDMKRQGDAPQRSTNADPDLTPSQRLEMRKAAIAGGVQ